MRYIKNVAVYIYHIVIVLKITFFLELLLGAVVILLAVVFAELRETGSVCREKLG